MDKSYRESPQDRAVRSVLQDVASGGGQTAEAAVEILRDVAEREIRLYDLARIRKACGMPISAILDAVPAAGPGRSVSEEVSIDGPGI